MFGGKRDGPPSDSISEIILDYFHPHLPKFINNIVCPYSQPCYVGRGQELLTLRSCAPRTLLSQTMTGTHHHSITPAHKHDETPAETVHVVKPSSQHKVHTSPPS